MYPETDASKTLYCLSQTLTCFGAGLEKVIDCRKFPQIVFQLYGIAQVNIQDNHWSCEVQPKEKVGHFVKIQGLMVINPEWRNANETNRIVLRLDVSYKHFGAGQNNKNSTVIFDISQRQGDRPHLTFSVMSDDEAFIKTVEILKIERDEFTSTQLTLRNHQNSYSFDDRFKNFLIN